MRSESLGFRSYSILLLSVLLGASSAIAGKPYSDIPVSINISGSAGGYALLVQGDSLGSYVNTTQVTSKLVTNMRGNDLILTTYYGNRQTASNRSVFFSLTEPASPNNPPAPFQQANVQAHINVKCSQVDQSFTAMQAGASVSCPGVLRFRAPDGRWFRHSLQPENFPEVDYFRVTCNSSDSSGCLSWSVTPDTTRVTGSSDPNAKALTRLLQIDVNGGILADFGNYYLSFQINASR